MPLPHGLYEQLLTRALSARLADHDPHALERAPLTEQAAPEVLARHAAGLLRGALRGLPGEGRLEAQIQLVDDLIAWLIDRVGAERCPADAEDGPSRPPQLLLGILDEAEARLGEARLQRPSIPLRHSDLLTNGPRDLRVGHEIRRELASADRVDVLVSFLKWRGVRLIREALRGHLERRPGGLRILTTTYMGATDPEAVEALLDLGAEVRVSYDHRQTRLHAKAWVFHRDSGFSTGLVGSSNLSHTAMVDGREWNVRLSQVDNGPILRKLATTFEQYWADPTFEPYQPERFQQARRASAAPSYLVAGLRLDPHPHQREILEALDRERALGRRRNLVVAATGTGKTVIAALDYRRLRRQEGALSLLFVAHRKEILQQSLAAFRVALSDEGFGELLVDGQRPREGRHVFASIQSLGSRLEALRPDAYDVLIVDEFHHAAARTYQALLERLEPRWLIGLTATPERADGRSVLGWFGHRVAAELRLWDALDKGLLVPFQYFGLHDDTDLSRVDFRGGRYDQATLERLYTADHLRAERVLREIHDKIHAPLRMRALGFCVSVKHAEFMAAFARSQGLPARAVHGQTPREARADAVRALRAGEIVALFTVDVFNEGVDLPEVDTILFLRPTESATIFLQQLGRGLRLAEGKACLTVLDFIGRAHRQFRFDRRFGALIGGTRGEIAEAIEAGFPRLPTGCDVRLSAEAQAAVLQNVRQQLKVSAASLREALRATGDVGLSAFLERAGLDPEALYRSDRSYTSLLHDVGLRPGPAPRHAITRALPRLLHVDDEGRIEAWRGWLGAPSPPAADPTDPHQLMLFAALGGVRRPISELGAFWAELWGMPDVRRELGALLEERPRRATYALPGLALRVHATYSRDEIAAGLLQTRGDKLLRTQGGVLKIAPLRCDVLYVTLEKDEREFTPTTLYNDYALSPTRFHWESQGVTRAGSETGRRYQRHASMGWRILLFVRQRKQTRGGASPYRFLGPVVYERHASERPMQIVWRLEREMPTAFWRRIKCAAG